MTRDLIGREKLIKAIVNTPTNSQTNTLQKALVKKEQKQKIMSIIAAKENKELENNSIDDLKKMLDELGE